MSNDYREYLLQCKLSLSPSQKQSPTGERAKNDSNHDVAPAPSGDSAKTNTGNQTIHQTDD